VISDSAYLPITNTVTASLMLASGPGQGSKDTVPVPPSLKATGSYTRASTKRYREDSDPDSNSESEDNDKADMEQMDFQSNATQYITETQALSDTILLGSPWGLITCRRKWSARSSGFMVP